MSQVKWVSHFVSALGWEPSHNSMAGFNIFSWVFIIDPKSNEEILCYSLLPELNRIKRDESLDIHWYPEVQRLWYSLQLSMFYINIPVKCMLLKNQSSFILLSALFIKFEYEVVQTLEQFVFIISCQLSWQLWNYLWIIEMLQGKKKHFPINKIHPFY